MKKLYLLRHGKAGWGNPADGDHGRTLDVSGLEDCQRLGTYVIENGINPDQIFCSSAIRAQETLETLTDAADKNWPVTNMRDIYTAGASELLDIIHDADDNIKTLMIVGHNPTLHELSCAFAKAGPEKLLKTLKKQFPSGTIAGFKFDVEQWQEIKPASGTLISLDSPRDMPSYF